MEAHLSDYCSKHLTHYFKCTSEGCSVNLVCKYCSVESKESLGHLYEHFDFINKQEDEMTKFKGQIKMVEEFGELNKIFLEQLENAYTFTDKIFLNLENSRTLIISELRTSYCDKYQVIVNSFQEFVKKFSQKMEKLNTNDRNIAKEIRQMKTELDEKLKFLSDQQVMAAEFQDLNKKAEIVLLNMKIDQFFKGDFKLSFGIKGNCNWLGNSSNIVKTVSGKSGSYWTIKSEEVLTGAFEAKVKINSIDQGQTSGYWNYGMGIQRLESTKTDNYYDDSVLILSNGWIPQQFTGSGSNKQLFYENWKENDIIMIKRDEKNNVYFGKNTSESYVLGFNSISGSYRLILGFSTSCNWDEFELIELKINPTF